ncbi:hypothetical protein [uncultured Sunxiuqinia sp.]|uniref:hypothetical protein n=1 Tax=uncultured Sunxiuqinia sp. TaxID=1573825 RepID=UPI002AA650D8|nr:hypothetical protein [uncultured Sunxiuqinia sp.]
MKTLIVLLALIMVITALFLRLLKEYALTQKDIRRSKQEFEIQLIKRTELLDNAKEMYEMEKQLHAVIDKRLQELEKEFSHATTKTNLSSKKTERFTESYKKMLSSTLKLLKVEHSHYANR